MEPLIVFDEMLSEDDMPQQKPEPSFRILERGSSSRPDDNLFDMTSPAYSPAFAATSPAYSPAFAATSPAYSPTFAATSPAYSPTSPTFAPSSPPFAPSPLGSNALTTNPYTLEELDKYAGFKSSSNKTLDAYIHTWISKQTKPNKPLLNRLDGFYKMTRFEKAKLLGFRAHRLEQGDAPRVPTTPQDTVFTVAEREFERGLLADLVIDRVRPDGQIVSIAAGDLVWLE